LISVKDGRSEILIISWKNRFFTDEYFDKDVWLSFPRRTEFSGVTIDK